MRVKNLFFGFIAMVGLFLIVFAFIWDIFLHKDPSNFYLTFVIGIGCIIESFHLLYSFNTRENLTNDLDKKYLYLNNNFKYLETKILDDLDIAVEEKEKLEVASTENKEEKGNGEEK